MRLPIVLRKEDRTDFRRSEVGFVPLWKLTVIDQFPYLNGIAFSDDTIFNQWQMKFVAAEAARLKVMIEAGSAGMLPEPRESFIFIESLDELITFASEGQGPPGHLFLWIIGA